MIQNEVTTYLGYRVFFLSLKTSFSFLSRIVVVVVVSCTTFRFERRRRAFELAMHDVEEFTQRIGVALSPTGLFAVNSVVGIIVIVIISVLAFDIVISIISIISISLRKQLNSLP